MEPDNDDELKYPEYDEYTVTVSLLVPCDWPVFEPWSLIESLEDYVSHSLDEGYALPEGIIYDGCEVKRAGQS